MGGLEVGLGLLNRGFGGFHLRLEGGHLLRAGLGGLQHAGCFGAARLGLGHCRNGLCDCGFGGFDLGEGRGHA